MLLVGEGRPIENWLKPLPHGVGLVPGRCRPDFYSRPILWISTAQCLHPGHRAVESFLFWFRFICSEAHLKLLQIDQFDAVIIYSEVIALDTQLQSKELSLVVCGRFDEVDEEAVTPGPETKQLIDRIIDTVQRKELHPYVSVNFCNCGNAYEYGPSVTVLPEQVRYLDVDDEKIETIVDRHVEDVVREGNH